MTAKTTVKTLAFGLMAATALAGTAQADKLDDIIASGTLRCAVVLDFPPMGMRDDQNNPIGFDVDYCNDLAKALGVEVDHESFDKAAEELAKPVTDDEFDRAKAGADDPYKRMAEHMRGCEKAMRHVGEAATGAAEAVRRFVGVPPALAAPYGETDLVEWRKKFAASLREQGFRICHARSARKHRRQGQTVVPLHGGWYAWRPADYLHPYQRDALARFVSGG